MHAAGRGAHGSITRLRDAGVTDRVAYTISYNREASMKKSAFIVISVFASVVLSAGLLLAEASFTGTWNTAWGPVEMKQTGARVEGTYGGKFPGRLQGSVEGRKLSFEWIGDNGEQGKGVFVLSDDGTSFVGTWGSGASDSNGGPWNGARVK